MIKELYFSTKDNDIVFSADVVKAYYLKTGIKIDPNDVDRIRFVAVSMAGIERELKRPSPVFLVKHGHKCAAVRVYRDIHNTTLREAHDAVEKIAESLLNGGI